MRTRKNDNAVCFEDFINNLKLKTKLTKSNLTSYHGTENKRVGEGGGWQWFSNFLKKKKEYFNNSCEMLLDKGRGSKKLLGWSEEDAKSKLREFIIHKTFISYILSLSII